jgi:putative aldouronate transport system substrate-binding protein
MLHAIQQKFRDAGVEEMAAFVAEKAKERDDIGF